MHPALLLLILSAAWLATIALLLTRAVQQYGRYEIIRPLPASPPVSLPPLAVVLPARNEQETIGTALQGLTAQDYLSPALQIIVVDDQSTDNTADIVRSAAQSDGRVQLIRGDVLPTGWAGKPHACTAGARAATQTQPPPQYLCFIDADVTAGPALLRTAVAVAEQRRLDFLSLEPTQQLLSWSERLILPTGFLLLAFIHDVGAVNNPANPQATANGQFILVRSDAYHRLHGHAASSVRNAICEDAALARLFKGNGCRIALCGTENLLQARMYRSFSALWEGLGKNLTEMIGSARGTLLTAASAIALAVAYITLPLATSLLLLHAHAAHPALLWIAWSCALAGSGALLGTHIGTATYLKIPWWYGVLFPAGYLLGAALAVSAVLRRWRHQVSWKGRVYDATHQGSTPSPLPKPAKLPEPRG